MNLRDPAQNNRPAAPPKQNQPSGASRPTLTAKNSSNALIPVTEDAPSALSSARNRDNVIQSRRITRRHSGSDLNFLRADQRNEQRAAVRSNLRRSLTDGLPPEFDAAVTIPELQNAKGPQRKPSDELYELL